jgi:hypothetical protein
VAGLRKQVATLQAMLDAGDGGGGGGAGDGWDTTLEAAEAGLRAAAEALMLGEGGAAAQLAAEQAFEKVPPDARHSLSVHHSDGVLNDVTAS